MKRPLLEISALSTVFHTDDGDVRAVEDSTFSVHRGQTVGLVGESGCGKSVTGLSILGLVPPPGKIVQGQILYRCHDSAPPIDLARLPPHGDAIRSIRGNDIAMVFQEPMTSLNPVYTVGDQIAEAVILHQHVDKTTARVRAIDMLARVGIPNPKQRVDEYPHQLSGGMRQRVMIAMALCCEPSLLIADEPTTALDVTIQAQVLDLMKLLQRESGMSIIIITHDMGVIADMADSVLVMYAGRIVEQGTPEEIFYNPLHPYTQGLLASIPKLGNQSNSPLASIQGTVPHFLAIPQGCPFRPRCSKSMPACIRIPELRENSTSGASGNRANNHAVRCWLYE